MTVAPLGERARKRVAEIQVLARGDRHQATRLLKAAIDRDAQLLRELVEPFLDGILANALAGPGTTPAPSRSRLSEGGMQSLMRGLEATVGATAQKAGESSRSGHADTIRALAEAQARRRRDNQ